MALSVGDPVLVEKPVMIDGRPTIKHFPATVVFVENDGKTIGVAYSTGAKETLKSKYVKSNKPGE